MISDFLTDIQAVVFDMDGILLDTESISHKTWKRAGLEFNICDAGTVYHNCVGSNLTDTLAFLRKQYGTEFDADAFMRRTSTLFTEMEKQDGIPLMDGAKAALEYLKPKYRLALASSTKRATVTRQLTEAGLIGYFETLTCGDEVAHSKPDPEIYVRACASLAVPPHFCAAVEDSPNGIKSAHSAGLAAIMVPDLIQPDDELKKLTARILPSLQDIDTIL